MTPMKMVYPVATVMHVIFDAMDLKWQV